MKSVIVLAMHGMPPKDFPSDEKQELMRLRTQVQSDPKLKKRHDELDAKMRNWSRSKDNDPFFTASLSPRWPAESG